MDEVFNLLASKMEVEFERSRKFAREVTVEWDGAGKVYLTGPAEVVFEEEWKA